MQKIGIGYERYKDFLDNDMYYVDKTLLIRDIVDKGGRLPSLPGRGASGRRSRFQWSVPSLSWNMIMTAIS